MATKRSFMPMYWGDYLADTTHLSTTQHGAYMLLIGRYWTAGVAPDDDDDQLSRTARLSAAAWRAMRPTIAALFDVRDGKWFHRRIEKELSVAAERYAKRALGAQSTNAKRDAQRTDSDTLSDRSAPIERDAVGSVRALARQPQPHSPVGEVSLAQGSSEPFARAWIEVSERLWRAHPNRAVLSANKHSNPKKPALEKFQQIVKRGADPEIIIRGAEQWAVAERGKDPEHVAQLVTWLHQARWEQYAAQPAGPTVVSDEIWIARLKKYPAGQVQWPSFLGPAPGHPDCRVPKHLLENGAADVHSDDDGNLSLSEAGG